MSNSDLVVIGCLGRPVGIRGFLNLNSYTNPKENILDLLPWKIKIHEDWQDIAIDKIENHGNKLVVRLAGCSDRDIAATFTNSLIAVKRSKLPKPSKNEYYWNDLINLEVINKNNINLGIVSHLFATPANDILVVEQTNPKKQHLIPFIKNAILSVDLEKKIILVDWDENF